MTRQVRYADLVNQTENQKELHNDPELDSSHGFTQHDIDQLWANYKQDDWMFVEEKCYMQVPSFAQQQAHYRPHKWCMLDPTYKGFHLLQFEKTGPKDGKIYLNGKEITYEQWRQFYRFNLPASYYKSYDFPALRNK